MRLIVLSLLIISIGCNTSDTDEAATAPRTSLPDVQVPSNDLLAPPIDTPKPDCVPTKTCADYPNQCGSALSDGCIGTLDCSSTCLPPTICLPDETCGEPSQCVPNCTGAACGGDGCGGSCGTCTDGAACVDGQCVTDCTPSCDGKSCGDDGCGASCGSCSDTENCVDGQCVTECTPDCDGKTCGDNGCGDVCGVCEPDFVCTDGQCESSCTPDCDGKTCGDNGCGDVCGVCEPDSVCVAGTCESLGSGALVLNEVLLDPAPELAGDANCDGVREGSQDEFVEIVNDSTVPFDLSGATLSDSVGARHIFADGTILGPKGAIIVFGGGTPTFDGTGDGAWCGSLPQSVYVVTASTGQIGLNNGGDTVTLTLADTTEVFSITINGDISGNDQSVVRSPEFTGDWVEHGSVSGTIGAHSPGTRTDGSAF